MATITLYSGENCGGQNKTYYTNQDDVTNVFGNGALSAKVVGQHTLETVTVYGDVKFQNPLGTLNAGEEGNFPGGIRSLFFNTH